MKKIIPALALLFSGSCAEVSAQSIPYGNEWIVPSQDYFKIKITSEGIYRIDSLQMVSSQIPAALRSADHHRIQIFHSGAEQYIYIYDANGNNIINAGDFIEFYGDRNDGSFDTQLYADSNWQPNNRYSLFSDTAAYFLTWNNYPFSPAGKRVIEITDVSGFSTHPNLPYFTRESYVEEVHDYGEGSTVMYDEDYGEAEGYMSDKFSSSMTENAPTRNIYSGAGGPQAFVTTVVCGRNNNLKHIIVTANGTAYQIADDSFYGFEKHTYSAVIPLNQLASPTTAFQYALVQPGGYASVANLILRYPHTMSFAGEAVSAYRLFVQDETASAKAELDLTNFNFSGYHIFYDLTNHKRINGLQAGNTLNIYVPNSGGEKFCFMTDSGHVKKAIPVPISFMGSQPRQFTNMLSSSVAADSAYVIVTHSTLWSEAQSYKQYRSGSGGNFNVVMVDIDELYDQFAYGIRKHPLAIKNFARFMMDKWTAPPLNKVAPSYMFLIGKGYSPNIMRNDATKYNGTLVPTFGVYGSDVLFTSGPGFTGSLWDPVIPIGRLSAKSLTDITHYLTKVQDYEMMQTVLPPPKWMKEVIHFGGGADQGQQNNIRNYLEQYKDTVEAYKYGGHVSSYFKTSTDPIQINQSDSLQKRINDGVSIMTFFGHAAASGFDISTDDPAHYHNYQKYPLVIANSCFAGNLFTDVSVSEDFVLQQDKGAIGFIASVNKGYEQDLFSYTVQLYDAFSDTLYGKTIGRCMQYAIRQIQTNQSSGIKIVSLEMLLHGDPAIRMNSWPKPELEINQPDIFFTPAEVNTQLDSFKVNVIVHNRARGVAPTDSFYVNIRRIYPDGSDTVYSVKHFGCQYADTISQNIVMNVRSAGLNQFKVLVDSLSRNDVPELYDEVNNNQASTTLLISSSDIYPVYPYKYAIVPFSTVTLKASTADPFAPQKRYVFEIDTTDAFNSPSNVVHRLDSVTSVGGVVSWVNNLPALQDSMVYYWRVAIDSVLTDTVHYHWNESSFIYIPAKTGWSQAHFFQFKNDKYTNIIYNKPQRKWDYVQEMKTLHCKVFRQPAQVLSSFFEVNNATVDQGTCFNLNPKIHVAVFDSLSFLPWDNDSCSGRYFGQANYWSPCTHNFTCLDQALHWFQFDLADTAAVSSVISMLDTNSHKIPRGSYVLVYSFGSYPYSTLGLQYNSLLQDFNRLGGTHLTTNLQDNDQFIFFAKVGDPSSAVDTIGTTSDNQLEIFVNVQVNWNRGNITSEVIGPSLKWTSLHWKQHPLESPTTQGDSILLQVIGIDNAGIESTIINEVTTSAYDTTLGFISASQYPFLKLVAVTKDTSLKTPPQMNRWQIYYDEAPEAAMNPARYFSFHANPLTEGDTLTMKVAVENISQVPMDSIGVDFYLYDNNRNRVNLKSYKEDSLRLGQYVIADLKYPSTFGLAGSNSLWAEANPYNQWHQTEQYHYNNFAHLGLNVKRDVTNPILDVTFDAVHIIDGDIVSGKPHILVQLHDENKFLALNDTASFSFFLTTPSQASAPVYFFNSQTSSYQLRFTPAVLPKNSCKIDWDPVFSEDGKYTLMVHGRDRSANYSGIYQYKISFEVVNRSTITNVMNYPNPFSTSTRFVFTLTGSVVPTDFKIQIMTVTGKVVREIMRDELGNIHIGRNITDYAWDGKDEYGDRLANGLYLYRVITKINGQDIEKRETEADHFFKNGFGKMYLMR